MIFLLLQCNLLTIEAKMGRNRVVVATLLVNSVDTETMMDKSKVTAFGDIHLRGSICFPIQSESPDAWETQEGNHFRAPGLQFLPGQGAQLTFPILSLVYISCTLTILICILTAVS
jgi:hypothetical protein